MSSKLMVCKLFLSFLIGYTWNVYGVQASVSQDVSYDTCLCNKLFDILVDVKAKWNDAIHKVDQLEKKVKKIENQTSQSQKGKTCAFYARRNIAKVVVAGGKTITYDDVITDTCNAFNKSTSVFICPYPGVYVFHYFTLDNADNLINYMQLMKNGDIVAYTWSKGQGGYHEMAGNTAIVNLQKGDKVYVRAGPSFPAKPYGSYTTFSGFTI